MSTPSLDAALSETASKGWTLVRSSLVLLEAQVRLTGKWAAMESKSGGGIITELRPKDRGAAPRSSLSAKYGLGAFPPHTDGAHLRVPPRFVLLENAGKPGVATTNLWRRPQRAERPLQSDWDLGMFQVGWGPDAFLAPALSGAQLRFDPGCMEPMDRHARRVAAWILCQEPEHALDWSAEADEVLIIDNHAVLHGRSAVERNADGRILRRLWIGGRDQ